MTSFTGLLMFDQGHGTYLGGWKKGMYHGYGIYVTSSGVSYQGSWWSGSMHGIGTFTWPSGQKFEGEFDQDKRKKGVMVSKDGLKRDIYENK